MHRRLRQQHPLTLDVARARRGPDEQSAQLDVPQVGNHLQRGAADTFEHALRHLDRPRVRGLEPVGAFVDGCAYVDAGDGLDVPRGAGGRQGREVGAGGERAGRVFEPGPPGVRGLRTGSRLRPADLLHRQVVEPHERALGGTQHAYADGAAGRPAHGREPPP